MRHSNRLAILWIIGLLLAAFISAEYAGAALPAQDGSWVVVGAGDIGAERISMLSADEGWALGLAHGGTESTVYHWDGNEWSQITTIPGQDIYRGDIQMTSPTDGWIVLAEILDYESKSHFYHWDGTTWSFYDTVSQPSGDAASAFYMLSPDDIWLVSKGLFWGQFYRWNGVEWSLVATTPIGSYADTDIAMLSDSDGWAVGLSGDIAHWNGSEWSSVASPTTANLTAIDMVSANDGWAVGRDGVILRWDGSAWQTVPSPTTSVLEDIDMVSANNGWAVGRDGVILHWDGSSWTITPSPFSGWLHNIEMISDSDGWIVPKPLRYVVLPPTLDINYKTGAPESFFTLTGADFPSNETVTVTVNGQELGTVPTDGDGALTFLLSTDDADEGAYFVTASVNPSATTQFTLASDEPVRPQDGTGTVFDVPSGIAFTETVYLPLTLR